MTASEIPRSLRDLIRARAEGRCEYCTTSEWLSGLACEIDHIVPRASGGLTEVDNLCLACSSCNGHKHARTHGADPESEIEVSLFHRRQRWTDHFAWSRDGARITGRTTCGRATIEALKFNNDLIVAARAIWVIIGLHPPAGD